MEFRVYVRCIYTEDVLLVEFRVYVRCIYTEDVLLVEFRVYYVVFTQRMCFWWSLEFITLYLHRECTSGGV